MITDVGGHQKEIVLVHKGASPTREAFFMCLNNIIMDNVKTLRDDLIKAYKQLREGSIGITDAKGLANMAGKIMSTAKTQMEFNKMTGKNQKRIKFLESDD